jgi:hypothetical protein
LTEEDDSWGKQQVEGGRWEIGDAFGERLTWRETGHVASNEWMMRRREDHVDERGEVGG